MSIDSHIEIITKLIQASGKETTKVLAVEYKLAPENPFPFAINEAVKVYKYMLEELHISSSVISFGGDSAGGGLVLATLLSSLSLNLPMPSCAVLLSPWVDLECNDQSYGNVPTTICCT